MAPKRGVGNPKKAAAGANRDNEWVPSLIEETELNGMVEAAFFLTVSLPDGVWPMVRPSLCCTPTKL